MVFLWLPEKIKPRWIPEPPAQHGSEQRHRTRFTLSRAKVRNSKVRTGAFYVSFTFTIIVMVMKLQWPPKNTFRHTERQKETEKDGDRGNVHQTGTKTHGYVLRRADLGRKNHEHSSNTFLGPVCGPKNVSPRTAKKRIAHLCPCTGANSTPWLDSLARKKFWLMLRWWAR